MSRKRVGAAGCAIDHVVVDDVSLPMPEPASVGMTALPIPPAPTTATLAAFSRRWPIAADLRQHDLPRVAVQLVVAKLGHRPVLPNPPLPRAFPKLGPR